MGFQLNAKMLTRAPALLLAAGVLWIGIAPTIHASEQVGQSAVTNSQDATPRFVIPTTHDGIGRIVAQVRLNGAGPFRFVVDTGATHSAVSAELSKKLNLVNQKAGATSVLLSGVTGSAQVAIVRVESLEVG
jgi:predicted aspartyl protease